MVETWIFTFGSGHRLVAGGTDRETNAGPSGEGFSLHKRYVELEGTWTDTRAEMVHLFGNKWAFQYADEDDAGVEKHGLRRLDLTNLLPS